MRALLLAILLLTVSSAAAAQDWRDPDLGQRIVEGVATRQTLWLRGQSGGVVRFDRATGERTVLATAVIDILPDGRHLWLLSGDKDGSSFVIRDLRAAEATPIPVGISGVPIALVRRPGAAPDVLATRSYSRRAGDRWNQTELAATLDPFALVATGASGAVYAGYNRGEFGGGLRRVDTDTGAVSFVSQPGDDLCGGALNPACEPVVGLFQDPQAPDCVIVGTGLSHMGISFGHVSRVCGSRISSVFVTPTPAEPDRWMLGPQPWPLDALVETSDGWIALSRDRYFQSRRGQVEERPLPVFEDWAGLKLSREADGELFIVSACCWGNVDHPTLFSTLAIPVVE